jgi:hypothetical protein
MERNNHSEVGSNLGHSLRAVAQHPYKNLFLKLDISCPIISYILFVDSQAKFSVWDQKYTLSLSLYGGIMFHGPLRKAIILK